MLGEFYEAQIENADIVVLNKVDLVPAGVLERVRQEIREINPEADILFAEHADVDPDYLLDRQAGEIAARSARAAPGGGDGQGTPAAESDGGHGRGRGAGENDGGTPRAHDHDHDHGEHDPHASAPAESFVLAAPANPERAGVERFFRALPDSVWRAKGFMRIDGTPCLVQYSLGQLEISPAAARANENIVFIGRHMDRPVLERQFAAAARAQAPA